jgi:hypothetical protein
MEHHLDRLSDRPAILRSIRIYVLYLFSSDLTRPNLECARDNLKINHSLERIRVNLLLDLDLAESSNSIRRCLGEAFTCNPFPIKMIEIRNKLSMTHLEGL